MAQQELDFETTVFEKEYITLAGAGKRLLRNPRCDLFGHPILPTSYVSHGDSCWTSVGPESPGASPLDKLRACLEHPQQVAERPWRPIHSPFCG